jgi:hypothetical protein
VRVSLRPVGVGIAEAHLEMLPLKCNSPSSSVRQPACRRLRRPNSPPPATRLHPASPPQPPSRRNSPSLQLPSKSSIPASNGSSRRRRRRPARIPTTAPAARRASTSRWTRCRSGRISRRVAQRRPSRPSTARPTVAPARFLRPSTGSTVVALPRLLHHRRRPTRACPRLAVRVSGRRSLEAGLRCGR